MIRGSRIYPRAREQSDLPTLRSWLNDPEVTRFLGIAFPADSMEDEERFFAGLRDSSRRACAIVLQDGDRLIGSCELRGLRVGGQCGKIGIAIGARDARGMGQGSQAVRWLLHIGLEGPRLHRIRLTLTAYSQRGIAAYKQCGFQQEGRLREDRYLDGRWYDTLVMGVLEHEWQANH